VLTFTFLLNFDYINVNLVANLHLFTRQVWINQGDIILIGLRDYQDSKADVILKYTPDEARNLKTYGEFPESVRINDTVTFVDNDLDDDIEFGDEYSSDEEVDAVDAI
ncbi:eukaryotic translation initiation factor 1A, partial [Uranotaenia lowii]|uniref:eukaryotic translation initiation factor 1A n=1 Tax=Uranotaenia lowii TaxID=190385 RepID=UPI00247AA86C